MRDQAVPGHNRWHPDIPPAVTVRPGQSIRVECREWTPRRPDRRDNDSANDVRDVDLTRAHMLSGPIHVEGAEPGDLLAVKIEQIVPANRGFTMIMPGFGFLRDLFTTPFLVHWEMANGFAVSPQLPGRAHSRRAVHGRDGRGARRTSCCSASWRARPSCSGAAAW